MPDTTCQIEDLVAGGDRVWARLRGRGTHTGAFMGRPPTGKHIDLDILDVCRFEDGRIAEHWRVPDRLGMLEQMGLVPTPQHASSRS